MSLTTYKHSVDDVWGLELCRHNLSMESNDRGLLAGESLL